MSSDVLCLLPDPILQHHGDGSNIIGSSLGSPDLEDSKDVEDLVSCHWRKQQSCPFCIDHVRIVELVATLCHVSKESSQSVSLNKTLQFEMTTVHFSCSGYFTSFVKGYRAASRSLMCDISARVFQCFDRSPVGLLSAGIHMVSSDLTF